MHSIVLARYEESLDWIESVPEEFCIYIYNKGKRITSKNILRRANHIVDRPNIGRESETYLHHMARFPKNDKYFTVYSQGDPFLHSPDLVPLLHNWRDWSDVQALSWAWKEEQDVPPRNILAVARASIQSRLLVRPELFSLHNWGPLEFHDHGARGVGLFYTLMNGAAPENLNIAGHVLRRCKLDALAEEAERHLVGTFSYGAIFAAKNERSAAIPREALAALRDFACEPIHINGYILERLWLHLMGEPFLRAKSRTDSGREAYELPPELVPHLHIRDKPAA